MILNANKGGQINISVISNEPNKAFLVPNLCRATKKW